MVKCESVEVKTINEIHEDFFEDTLEIETLEELPETEQVNLKSERSTRLRKRKQPSNKTTSQKVKKPIEPSKINLEFTEEEENVMKENAEMKCEICSVEFTGWVHARTHYRSVHKKHLGWIRCCGRKIDRKHEMIDHVKWHQDPTIFSCHTCGKSLLTKEYLLMHEATHIPEELRQFECQICKKKYGSLFSLQNHTRLHRRDNLKKTIPCPECPDKKYKTEAQLRIHLYNCHKNRDSFMCELCSKIFKMKRNLELHIKSHIDPDKPIRCEVSIETLNLFYVSNSIQSNFRFAVISLKTNNGFVFI